MSQCFAMIEIRLRAATNNDVFYHRKSFNLLLVLFFSPTENNNTTINNNNNHSSSTEHESGNKDRDNGRDIEKDRSRSDKEREKNPSSDHKANSASPKRPTSRDFPPEREKNWNYPPGLDNIMATGAFWQNYSGEQQINSTPANCLFQPLAHKDEKMEKYMNSNSLARFFW